MHTSSPTSVDGVELDDAHGLAVGLYEQLDRVVAVVRRLEVLAFLDERGREALAHERSDGRVVHARLDELEVRLLDRLERDGRPFDERHGDL